MRLKDNYHIYALITIIFWSLAYVLTRMTSSYFSAFSLGFLRYFVATCCLIVIAVILRIQRPHKKDIPLFILSGSVGFFFYMITFNKGQALVTAATGSVIIATVPVITAVFARIVYKEKIFIYQWAAIAVEFAGVICLTLLNSVFSTNDGLVWMLLAALCLSSYNLIQRKLTKKYSALQTTAFSIFFGTALLAIFLPEAVGELQKAPVNQYVYIVIMGVFSSAVAYVSWSKAFEKAEKTSQVSNYMFITPFITSILGIVIAGEVPDLATIIGGIIILAGMFIFNFGGKYIHRRIGERINIDYEEKS